MSSSAAKTNLCRRCLTAHLDRVYNDHAQKCRCLCNYSPTSIEARDTRIILAVSRFDICDNGISGRGLYSYILFKSDVRHRMHCLVLIKTNLYIFYDGKTNFVNQRWRHTTCLQHPCYDVGCYP